MSGSEPYVVSGECPERGPCLGAAPGARVEHDEPALPPAGVAFDPRAWGAAGEADPRVVQVWHAVLSLASQVRVRRVWRRGSARSRTSRCSPGCSLRRIHRGPFRASRGGRRMRSAGRARSAAHRTGVVWPRGAHRLARAAQFADEHPATAEIWAAGIITADHPGCDSSKPRDAHRAAGRGRPR